jgi:hypothetical protein
MEIALAFGFTWLMFGLLHFALCMKDWQHEARKGRMQPHAWRYAVVVFVPMVLFGPVGLVVRSWAHATFPHIRR